jgi:hypothetical protein
MNVDQAVPTATLALRRTAWLCVALMAVVVVASAFLRHLGAVVLVVLARRARSSHIALAWGLLGVGLLLSVVGVVAGASRATPVVLLNLLGGLAMLGLCVRLAAGDARNGNGRAAAWLLALIVLQAAGGAIASTQASALCGLFTDCSVIAVVHRLSGVLLGLGLIAWGTRNAWRVQRWDGAALALIALLLMMLGVLAAGIGSLTIPVLVIAHNVLGATALAVLAWQA